MPLLLITLASLIASTFEQCANELTLEYYNTQLVSGLLPTYLLPKALITSSNGLMPLASNSIADGWTLSTTSFLLEINLDTQSYVGTPDPTTPGSGTIQVSNATIDVIIYFNLNNGSISSQGIAVINQFTGANYSFYLNNTASGNNAYSYQLVNSQINFSGALISYLYVNYPITSAERVSILYAINTQQNIQQALNLYYSNFGTTLQSLLSQFIILTTSYPNYTLNYESSSKIKSSYSYNISKQQILLQYQPQVGYFVAAYVNIDNLVAAPVCNSPLTPPNETQVYTGTAELISLDLIINSFNYGLQQRYFSTVLNKQFWPINYFTWKTGGLNGIITQAYTSFPYNTQISGFCNSTSGSFVKVNNASQAGNTISFALNFTCNLYASNSPLVSFNVTFTTLNIGVIQTSEVDIATEQEQAYLGLQIVGGNYTVTINSSPYNLNNNLIIWYVDQAITQNLFNSPYLVNMIPTQYRDTFNYTFTKFALLIEDSGNN